MYAKPVASLKVCVLARCDEAPAQEQADIASLLPHSWQPVEHSAHALSLFLVNRGMDVRL